MTINALKAAWHDNTVRVDDSATVLLVQAYRFHKQAMVARWRPTRDGLKSIPTRFSAAALERARADVANKLRRYPHNVTNPAVNWYLADESLPASIRHRERLAYVEKPEDAGLHFVGRVMPDCGGQNGYWDTSERFGWLTDPYGDSARDGTGLCYGLVYQLPARDGKARFVAGYQFGGVDDGPTIDFGSIYEGERADNCSYDGAQGNPAARDAARAADSMAQCAAKDERAYQTAWQAGNLYSDCLAELADLRRSILQIIRDMKGACATLRELPESLKARIRASLKEDLGERESIFEKMAKLSSGDVDPLIFYPGDKDMIAAFNEGAGKTVL